MEMIDTLRDEIRDLEERKRKLEEEISVLERTEAVMLKRLTMLSPTSLPFPFPFPFPFPITTPQIAREEKAVSEVVEEEKSEEPLVRKPEKLRLTQGFKQD